MTAKKKDKKKAHDASEAGSDANEKRLNPGVREYATRTSPRMSDRTGEFKKDWERLASSGRYDMSLLKTVMMHLIANDGPLPAQYLDHPLSGEYEDHRDCHITGDWVLIYRLTKTVVNFVRTGTHSELFKK
jgi:mRNA interferase YafQ